MRMKKTLFLILLIIPFLGSAKKKWDAVYINKLIATGEIDKVIDFYKTRYFGDNRDPQDAFRIADLYVKKKDYKSALEWYEKEKQLLKSNKTNFLNYANTYRLNGNYKEALDAYTMYAAETGDASKVMDYAYLCDKLIRASAMQNLYRVENYPYNTSADETNVTTLRNNLIYTQESGDGKDKFYQLKQAIREYDYFLEPVAVITKEIPYKNIDKVSYSKDGNLVAFSVSDRNEKNKLNPVVQQIYLAENLGGNFLNIKSFPFNVPGYNLTDPAFNSDGTILYFSSNQTGGYGGYDIWKSVLQNGNWTKPVNLGKLINSKFNENAPYLIQDKQENKLYFSSDRENGFGGWDIYTAKMIDDVWQDVQLLPYPINTNKDENSMVYATDTKTGYVSSTRDGGKGGYDIYRILPFHLKMNVHLADENGNKLDYALVQLLDGNTKLDEGVSNEDGTADFEVAKDFLYAIKATKDGYAPATAKTDTKGFVNGDSVELNLVLKKLAANANSTSTFSSSEYVTFIGTIIDGATNKPATLAKMRMINLNSSRIREVDIDENGVYQLKLFLNNNYKIIIENSSYKINDELTTYGLEEGQIKTKDYLLNGNKFKLTNNRVFNATTIPAELSALISKENKPSIQKVTPAATVTGTTSSSPVTPVLSATSQNGNFYKINLGSYAQDNVVFDDLAALGSIEKTNSYNQYVYRLGDFSTLDDAKLALEFAQNKGYFVAFILQYDNGKITNIIK